MPDLITRRGRREASVSLQRRLWPLALGGLVTLILTLTLTPFTPAALSISILLGAWIFAAISGTRHDSETQAGPPVSQIKTTENLWALAVAAAAAFTPVAWTGAHAAGAGLIVTITVASAGHLGRKHLRWQPTGTWLGLLVDAAARRPVRTRVVALLIAFVWAGLVATAGVSFAPVVVALLVVLVVTRPMWAVAKRDGLTRAGIHNALAGLFSGGAWTPALEAAGRIPAKTLTLDKSGAPEVVVAPLPPRMPEKKQEDVAIEIEDRFGEWGEYTVNFETGAIRQFTIEQVPPLPTALRWDGQPARDETVVWIGKGKATRAHGTAPATKGVRRGEQFDFCWDLRSQPHGIAVGLTGSGKSQTISLIVAQLLLAGWKVIAIDPKRVEFTQWEGRPGMLQVATDLEEQAEALETAQGEMMRRYEEMRAARVNHFEKLPVEGRPIRVLVVVDEVVELLSKVTGIGDETKEINALKERCGNAIGSILRLGRAAGVHLLLAGQRADRTIVAGEFQNNLSFKILQGNAETTERTMIGLNDVTATPGVEGRAVARTLKTPQTEVQVAYIDLDTDLDKYLPVGGEVTAPARPAHPDVDVPVEENVADSSAWEIYDEYAADSDSGEGEVAPGPSPSTDGRDTTPKHGGTRIEPLVPGEARQALARLIGLEATKAKIAEIEAVIEVNRRRAAAGVTNVALTPGNYIFHGPPGVGKTEVARIFGSLLRDLGALPSGHVISCTPADLKAGYVGQSGLRTRSACEDAIGGVLLVDEAYLLAADQFGDEVVGELLVHVENNRAQSATILAGYEQEMDQLLDTNPGLRSRFPDTGRVPFEAYDIAALCQIAALFVTDRGYALDNAAQAAMRTLIEQQDRESRDWASARSVRVLVDAAVGRHALRVSRDDADAQTVLDLTALTPADILGTSPSDDASSGRTVGLPTTPPRRVTEDAGPVDAASWLEEHTA